MFISLRHCGNYYESTQLRTSANLVYHVLSLALTSLTESLAAEEPLIVQSQHNLKNAPFFLLELKITKWKMIEIIDAVCQQCMWVKQDSLHRLNSIK